VVKSIGVGRRRVWGFTVFTGPGWAWWVIAAVALVSLAWMLAALFRLFGRRADVRAVEREATALESALVGAGVPEGAVAYDAWSFRVGARFAGRVRIVAQGGRVSVAGPRVSDVLYRAWMWIQGVLLALVVPMSVAAVVLWDGRWALAALVTFAASWAVSMVGAGLWPGLGELGAVASGRFRALDFPLASVREVDVGRGWSKGGLEVALFPYRAAIDAMVGRRVVSFFAPDERGREVRFALHMTSDEDARELADLLRAAGRRVRSRAPRLAGGGRPMAQRRGFLDPTALLAKDRHAARLRRDFERSLAAVTPALVERYGAERAGFLMEDARAALARLAPRVPWIRGPRGVVFNAFLGITAQELAAFHAFRDRGHPPEEAWSWCHRVLDVRLRRVPAWRRRAVAWLMGSALIRRVVARRARGGATHRIGGFEVRYLAGDGEGFDYGVDYLRCANRDFVVANDGAAFAPFVCLSDLTLSDMFGWGLTRTETLADGCVRCDFRFRSGGPTRISSSLPHVQAAIEASLAASAGEELGGERGQRRGTAC